MRGPKRQLNWFNRLAVLGLALLVGACASVSPRPRADRPAAPGPAQARSASNQAVAAQLQVSGGRGRLSQAQRSQLLARLGAQGSASLLNRQLAAMSDAVEGSAPLLFANNSAQLLIDGPTAFAAMFAAIEAARHSVLLQSYIVEDTAIAQQLAALLARKRAQGVQVALMYDDLGSIGTARAYFDALDAAGVPSCALHPVNPLARPGYWSITQRDHRKVLVIDRSTGFTGGINISAVYSTGSFGRSGRAGAESTIGWRDTQVALRGPAVAALDDLVRATWVAQGCAGALPAPPGLQANRAPAGAAVVRIIPTSPDDAVNRIYTLLLTAIDASQRSVYLTMAYFAPGQDMLDALCDAARRGVDVQLVLPARSDFAPVLYAGRSYYTRLLQAGVKVHELQDAVLHAKTAVIDGVVSTVGSSNMDWRSFAGNDELNAVVFGEDFGDAMLGMFQQDVRASQPITLAAWRDRPLPQRAKETLARWFEALW